MNSAMVVSYRSGVESIIAHCIAHNLVLDSSFDIANYIGLCREVMEELLVPNYLIEDILDEAETQGEIESLMPINWDSVDGASQIHPAHNTRLVGAIERLVKSLED
jgi:hypothetical protein